MAIDFEGTGGSGLQSDINVTPLVDVVLVLLIIFMVILPLTLRGYDVDIPAPSAESATIPEEPQAEQIVLTIDPADCAMDRPIVSDGLPEGCRVRLNGEDLPADDLALRVAELYADRGVEDRVLFLAADDRLNYEGVLRIVDRAKSGAEGLRIGLVTQADAGS